MQNEFDIVIMGSGLGGLVCGAILGGEGYRVCVLEKNRQLGGCLQTFARDKVLFDSGVHYLGGLEKGQNLYQVFKYLGLMDKLKLERMDEGGFDRIVFLEDGTDYPMAQGYEKFISTLSASFPGEEENIRRYCDKLKEICSKFPMYHLRSGGGLVDKSAVLDIDTKTFIESITDNIRLQEVLAGNNFLYAGEPYKTPLYVHALVLNSYIESAWKCVDGGSQITKWLARRIRGQGGVIRNHAEVVKMVEKEGLINYIQLKDGTTVAGKYFISNLHPKQTLAMTETTLFRAAYRNRVNRLANTISSFCVNAVMKPGAFPYYRHNYYIHDTDGVWQGISAMKGNWPQTCCMFFSASSRSHTHTEALSILAYMSYEEVAQWESSFNTDSEPSQRGESYEAFKQRKAEQLIAFAERKFPGLRSMIQSYSCTSPLTYRDYIGTSDGSLYGIAKDFRDPMGTYLPARTRIPNLFLTGQNLLLHGILGVTISALATCTEFVDADTLIEKIRNA